MVTTIEPQGAGPGASKTWDRPTTRRSARRRAWGTRTRRAAFVGILLGLGGGTAVCAGQSSSEPTGVPSLRPAELAAVPAFVVTALETYGCVVPQTWNSYETRKVQTNVVRGAFAAKGQEDWAVLCSRDGRSHIQVFWGGSARCPEAWLARESVVEDVELFRPVTDADRTWNVFVRELVSDSPGSQREGPPLARSATTTASRSRSDTHASRASGWKRC